MNEGLIPNRYAKALYKYATETKTADAIYGQMQCLDASYGTAEGLARAVENPFVPYDDKVSLLLAASGVGSDDGLGKFFKLVFSHGRESLLQLMARAYGRLYREANRISQVEITVAAQLPDAAMSKIKEAIQAYLKDRTPEYTEKVDPSLIGGFTVKIDSSMLDASISNELRKLRLKLLRKK